jgi:hypothetical protein
MFTIKAESAGGTAELEVYGPDFVTKDNTLSWTLSEPVSLVDKQSGKIIGAIAEASANFYADPVVNLNFVVSTGGSLVNFTVTSAHLSIPQIYDAVGRASMALTITDNSGDGATLGGNHAGNKAFRAFVNDVSSIPATGTVFATLGSDISTATPYGSSTDNEAFPLTDGFSTEIQDTSVLGSVSSMSSEFSFSVDAGSSASGTSTFAIQPPLKVRVTAESAKGRVGAVIPLTSNKAKGTTLTWTRDEPLALRDPDSGVTVATLDTMAAEVMADATVILNFVVSSGAATNFTVTSALLAFPPIDSALGYASAAITVSDFSGSGATVAGNNSDSQVYEAFYNDPGGPATGTTFATLLDGVSTPVGFDSNSASADFGAGEFSPVNESGAPLGTVSSISAQFQFNTSASSSASGTSIFAIGTIEIPVELETFDVD